MIIGAIFEMAGITLVVPVILTVLDNNSIQFDSYLQYFLKLFGLQNQDILSLIYLILVFYLIKNIFLILLIIALNIFLYVLYIYTSKEIFHNYLNQSYKSIVNQNLAIMIRNVTGETFAYQNAVAQLLFLLTELIVVVGIFILIFYFEPKATLITLFFLLILSLLFIFLSKKYYKKWGELRVYFSGAANKAVIESLKAFKEIRIYKKTKYFFNIFKENIIMHGKVHMYLSIFASVPRAMLETFGIFLLFVIMFFSFSQGFSREEMSETLILFSFCAIRLLPSINRIITHYTYLRYFAATTELMYNEVYIKKIQFDNDKKNSPVRIYEFKKTITLKNICFSYNKKDKFALENINLDIPVNAFVGIQGKSGSGKSTLIDIILGLNKPSSGQIIIDNNFIKNGYNIEGNWISYVPQNVYLTDDTIKKNIAFGIEEEKINIKRLEKSIQESELSEFISSLKDGINTIVGEDGIRLSGGQIQRIGIARALYNQPKLLILDESTSALDVQTENEILNSILKLKGKIAAIIISHRPNTMKVCDKIYKIESGYLT